MRPHSLTCNLVQWELSPALPTGREHGLWGQTGWVQAPGARTHQAHDLGISPLCTPHPTGMLRELASALTFLSVSFLKAEGLFSQGPNKHILGAKKHCGGFGGCKLFYLEWVGSGILLYRTGKCV